jgi:gliding motility-associated-like protein
MKQTNPKNFDHFIKESLDNYEIEYDPSNWTEIQQKLDLITPSSSTSNAFIGLKGLIVGGLITAGAISFALYSTFDFSKNAEIKNSIEETVTVNHNIEELDNPIVETTIIENHTSEVATKPSKKHSTVNNISVTNVEQAENELADNLLVGNLKTSVKIFSPIEKKHLSSPAADVEKTDELQTTQNQQLPGLELTKETQINEVENMVLMADFIFNLTSPCTPIASFTPVMMDENLNYEWNFSDGRSSTDANPTIAFSKPGKYTVDLTISSKKNKNLMANTTKDVIISPTSRAAADFDYTAINSGWKKGAHFHCKSKDAIDWQWDFGNQQVSKEKNPKNIYSSVGSYTVSLIITNKEGCRDTTKRIIRIEEKNELFAPYVISPDGDGKNDSFMPKALENTSQNFIMEIFDIKGKLVFKTQESSIPWNGRYMNSGEYLGNGDFFWVVKLTDESGIEKPYYGSIKLIKSR